MAGQCKLIGGLALVMMGILGECLACGLPMWRETSFVGSNIVSAQTVWDGLWLQCILQSTGQMQCKRYITSSNITSDIQAGRALTLISIIVGFLGFLVALLWGGVANCSGDQQDPSELLDTYSSRKKASLLGGVLCVLAGILCLVSVSWSAALTISVYNDPLVAAALKREVGSSIYIGWASSILFLLGGALICFVCGEKKRPRPSYYFYRPHRNNTPFSGNSSHPTTLRSDTMRSTNSRTFDRHLPRMMEHEAQVHAYNSLSNAPSEFGMYNYPQRTRPGDFRL